jgi:hypothetical protein
MQRNNRCPYQVSTDRFFGASLPIERASTPFSFLTDSGQYGNCLEVGLRAVGSNMRPQSTMQQNALLISSTSTGVVVSQQNNGVASVMSANKGASRISAVRPILSNILLRTFLPLASSGWSAAAARRLDRRSFATGAVEEGTAATHVCACLLQVPCEVAQLTSSPEWQICLMKSGLLVIASRGLGV